MYICIATVLVVRVARPSELIFLDYGSFFRFPFLRFFSLIQ